MLSVDKELTAIDILYFVRRPLEIFEKRCDQILCQHLVSFSCHAQILHGHIAMKNNSSVVGAGTNMYL